MSITALAPILISRVKGLPPVEIPPRVSALKPVGLSRVTVLEPLRIVQYVGGGTIVLTESTEYPGLWY